MISGRVFIAIGGAGGQQAELSDLSSLSLSSSYRNLLGESNSQKYRSSGRSNG